MNSGTEIEIIIAIGVSLLSLLVSAFVAGWNVYRDAIQKPKFRVSIGVNSIFQKGRPKIGPDIYVQALNLGPLPNRIGVVYAIPSWFDRHLRNKQTAFISYDIRHPGHTANGQRIEVGDTATFVFPLDSDFIDSDFSRVGVSDGFGNFHWAKRSALRRVRNEVEKLQRKDLDSDAAN